VEPIVCGTWIRQPADNEEEREERGGHGHDLLEICCSSSLSSEINMKYYSLLEIFSHFNDFIKHLHKNVLFYYFIIISRHDDQYGEVNNMIYKLNIGKINSVEKYL